MIILYKHLIGPHYKIENYIHTIPIDYDYWISNFGLLKSFTFQLTWLLIDWPILNSIFIIVLSCIRISSKILFIKLFFEKCSTTIAMPHPSDCNNFYNFLQTEWFDNLIVIRHILQNELMTLFNYDFDLHRPQPSSTFTPHISIFFNHKIWFWLNMNYV